MPAPLTTAEAIDAMRAEFSAKLERIEQFIVATTLRKPSRAEQAKAQGVTTNTVYRRERRLRERLEANGRI
jgi:hypothetical protein